LISLKDVNLLTLAASFHHPSCFEACRFCEKH